MSEDLKKLLAEATDAVQAVDVLASQVNNAEIYTAEDAMLDLQSIRRRVPTLRAAVNALPAFDALVDAAQAQLDYMDLCNDKGDLERNLRRALAAVRAALNQEPTPNRADAQGD